ncbi:cutinase [Macrophomina phaseolina]|uniref:Cutinase n=1 Tax=Macrophomina phaseolina TaxID=35725 RepID=A0ABQ8GPW1_9PEZI|nr:cutinase [Macrophomina phaseolina]
MHSFLFLTIPLLPHLIHALKPLSTHEPPCAEGLHIIAARDTDESSSPGTGMLGPLITNITTNVTGSDFLALSYPATNSSISVTSGIDALLAALNASATDCPTSKIALMGYGQGAQVVGDALCGSGRPALGKTLSDKRHIAGQPWNVGSARHNGVVSSRDVEHCKRYTNQTRSYCDANDYVCDSGKGVIVHQRYIRKYGKSATEFVIGKASVAGVA